MPLFNAKKSSNASDRRWFPFHMFYKTLLTISNILSLNRSESTSSDDSFNELNKLSALINDSLKKISHSFTSQNATFPKLNDPFDPASMRFYGDPSVMEAASHIVSAAAQVMALVAPPPLTVITAALQFHVTSSIGVVIDTHVVEILREAGPQGLHVNEISRKNNTDPNKLARILRLLATEHIFREVSPDVFANNRISSILDTGKSSAEIIAKPSEKHLGTSGIAAFIFHLTNHALKSSAYMTESMTDPAFAFSHEADKAPFNKAFRTDLPLFPWLERPENGKELALFGMAMEGGKNVSTWDDLEGYDWEALPSSSVVVDVGGGIGSQTLTLTQRYPQLKLVVQDRDAVIEDAKNFWKAQMPDAISEGRVQLQANDFFTGQPVKNAAVYFMRMVLHDWSDDHCIKILKHLRAAAAPNTQLILMEDIMSYACLDTNSTFSNIPGVSNDLPPSPLLPNNGHANLLRYLADIQMYALVNGQERTLQQYNALFEKSGWKTLRVAKTSYLEVGHQHIIAVPA